MIFSMKLKIFFIQIFPQHRCYNLPITRLIQVALQKTKMFSLLSYMKKTNIKSAR